MSFSELIERQISHGKELLKKLETLREIPVPQNDFGDGMAVFDVPRQKPKFDANQVASLKSEMQRWQNVTLDVLRACSGNDSPYIKQFQDTLSDKHYAYNVQSMMKREVSNGLDVLESICESLSLNLVNSDSCQVERIGKVKVFISHASADAVYITPFVEKVLKLGLELKSEEIAYTSEESYGVEPGENIANYIKENIACASVVLLMISPNYKKSEVCLNEMGAAWALRKKCVSVVLPTASFDQLGWISNLDKAVKFSNKKQVASLCEVIAKQLAVESRNKLTSLITYIDEFVSGLTEVKPVKEKPTEKTKAKRTKQCGLLQLFDASFNSVCLEEGTYVVQLDIRMRSESEDSSIRRVLLKNKRNFTGSSSKSFNFIEFKTYIRQGVFELYDNREYIDDFFSTEFWKERSSLIDMIVERDRNVSISFVQTIDTLRESDGYDELYTKGWHLVVQYNIDEEEVIPLTLTPVDSDKQGKYIG